MTVGTMRIAVAAYEAHLTSLLTPLKNAIIQSRPRPYRPGFLFLHSTHDWFLLPKS